MVALIKILQVILALSTLILIHELGHFLFARLFGIKVDKFFLFFDIGGVRLLSTRSGWFSRLFPSLKKLDTEYGIGWLPLGGYCKINGMVDESMDLEFLSREPQPWEFRSKPAWQRLLVMAGGVLNNIILAVLLYICILNIWGETYVSNVGTQIYAGELARDMGFRTGDRVLDLDGYVPEDFSMIQADIARRSVRRVNVLRDGDTVAIYIDQSRISEILNTPDMFQVAVPFIVDTIPESSPNFGGELRRGDRITGICGEEVRFVQDSRHILAGHRGERVPLELLRGGDSLSTTVQVDTNGLIGVYAQMNSIKTKEYGVLESIPSGIRMTFSAIEGYVQDLRMVATPSTGAYKSVGSFVSIGQIFPSRWNWYSFLYLLAMLSIMLGVMNLLPIPGLDGGHMLFTIYEMITGKKPGEKFLMVAQMIGFLLLMALMMLAFGNDIGRLLN
ncbi:MAG: RIP metalloprotease RseP [Candidatus Cryptobacteroides sp.]